MGPEGDVPHPQPASKLIDLDELKLADGWMRATAPGGPGCLRRASGVGRRPPVRVTGRPSGARSDDPETGEEDA